MRLGDRYPVPAPGMPANDTAARPVEIGRAAEAVCQNADSGSSMIALSTASAMARSALIFGRL